MATYWRQSFIQWNCFLVSVEQQDNRKRPLSDFIFVFFSVSVFAFYSFWQRPDFPKLEPHSRNIVSYYCDYSRFLIYLINPVAKRYSCIHSSVCKLKHHVKFIQKLNNPLTFARFGSSPLTLLMVSTSHVIVNYVISLYALGEADVG